MKRNTQSRNARVLQKAGGGSSAKAKDEYRRLAGEAEARNVQTRMDYSPEQRMAEPPWETLDVPEADQIVRF